MGVTVLDDSCGGATEINILLVSNQYFSQLKAEEEKKKPEAVAPMKYGFYPGCSTAEWQRDIL